MRTNSTIGIHPKSTASILIEEVRSTYTTSDATFSAVGPYITSKFTLFNIEWSPPSFPLAFWGPIKNNKFLVRSRRPFAPRRRRLTRPARSRRFAARARISHQAQPTVSEPIPLIQFPIATLSPPLEISYSPISNPSPISSANFPPQPPSPPQYKS